MSVQSSLGSGWGFSGFMASFSLHAAAISLMVYGLPYFRKDSPPPPVPIEIEFIQVAKETTVPTPKTPEPEQQTQAPEPEQRTRDEAPPIADLPDAVPMLDQVKLSPKPELQKPVEPPKPKPQISEAERDRRRLRSTVQPQARPQRKSRLDRSRLAALIDRSKQEEEQRTLEAEAEKQRQEAEKAEEKRQSLFAASRSLIATADLQTALKIKLAKCWNIPTGAKDLDKYDVTVRIFLREDGTLARRPELVRVGDLSNGFYRVFAESAVQAVRLCEPYEEAIPYVKSGKRTIDFRFDASDFAN